jgi:Cdc6-like AAA superfamily ATPase
VATIVEDIDEFAHSIAKQVLLYSLFELIHEEVCRLVVVGSSTKLDFFELLEKRIKSRLLYQDLLLLGVSLPDLEAALKSRMVDSDEEWTTSALVSTEA